MGPRQPLERELAGCTVPDDVVFVGRLDPARLLLTGNSRRCPLGIEGPWGFQVASVDESEMTGTSGGAKET